MTSSERHNLIARFDLFCFNTILLRRFSGKNIKKKFEEIEDISELHLLNKYCLVLNQKKTIYCKIKCGKRYITHRKKDAI